MNSSNVTKVEPGLPGSARLRTPRGCPPRKKSLKSKFG